MIFKGIRKDGWLNLLAGLGKKNSDKTKSTQVDVPYVFEDEELSSLYDGEGLGARIVDIIPNDMTRAGWEILNDDDNLIKKEMERLSAEVHLNKALKYARLYRGAIIVLVTKNSLDSPFTKRSGPIRQLRVYSAARMPIISTEMITDSNSPYFEDFEYFPVELRDGTLITVHRSRCLVFRGELTSDSFDLDFKYRYWGFSIFQRIYERLSYYGSGEQGVANLLLEFIIGKYKLSNLAQLLMQNTSESLSKIYNRMEIINASKSIINGVLLGENEDYVRDTANVSGLADLIDRQMMNLCSVCDIPVTRLFGRSAAGMNATGEGDLTNYYDGISSRQDLILLPELQELVNYIGSYVYPESVVDYPIEFNSLWEPTQKEQAEIDKLYADTYNIYMMNQVLDADQVQNKVFPELSESSSFEESDLGEEDE